MLPESDTPIERLSSVEAFSQVVVHVVQADDGRKWVHCVRTLVLAASEGSPHCRALIINYETEHFNAERFERAFAANPAPAIIARLADMRNVKVNRSSLELTGFDCDPVLGRSMHDFDVLRSAQQRDLAVGRLHDGETIPQMEGCLDPPGGQDRTVLNGDQPIEIGYEACMLFTLRRRSSPPAGAGGREHGEEKFSKAFPITPGPMAILQREGLRILDVNA